MTEDQLSDRLWAISKIFGSSPERSQNEIRARLQFWESQPPSPERERLVAFYRKNKEEKGVRLRNLTPNVISIANSDGEIIRQIPSEGNARVSSEAIYAGDVDGIPVNATFVGQVEGLPEREDGVYLLVSQIVIAALPGRTDLLRPDTGPTCVRGDDGEVIAVRGLTR